MDIRILADIFIKPWNLGDAKDLRSAFTLFALVSVLAITFSWGSDVYNLSSLIIDDRISELTDSIPQYHIADGRLFIDDDSPQPIFLGESFIIDTTGTVTEPPVSAEGTSILITSTEIISRDNFQVQSTNLSVIEEVAKNNGELNTFVSEMMNFIIVLVIVFTLFFRILALIIFVGVITAILTIVGWAACSIRGKKKTPQALACAALYSMIPYLILSTIGVFLLPWLLGKIGLIWSFGIFTASQYK